MNNARRKAITDIAQGIEDSLCELEELQEEEQEYFDNIPENLQGAEAADNSQRAIDALEENIQTMRDTCDTLKEEVV